jgi:hypothetical protein
MLEIGEDRAPKGLHGPSHRRHSFYDVTLQTRLRTAGESACRPDCNWKNLGVRVGLADLKSAVGHADILPKVMPDAVGAPESETRSRQIRNLTFRDIRRSVI